MPILLTMLLAGLAPVPPMQDPVVHAPDLVGREWLNTDRPLPSWKEDLKGQVVLLDFWTYCCINCLHVLPDLAALEKEFADEPFLVIGVHSNKFEQEGEAQNIRQAILRHHIEHPVVVDADMRIWKEFAVRAWPTRVLVDPEGYVVAKVSGEGYLDEFRSAISDLLAHHREKGTLAEAPIRVKREEMPATVLRFPGKVRAHDGRLFVSDSSAHRVLEVDPESGAVRRRFGSGGAGLRDGAAEEARFRNPQGLAVHGGHLYVADTDNHALRRIDLESGRVETVGGTGKQARPLPEAGPAGDTAWNSPWDIAVDGDVIHVAMAGSHQLWTYRTVSGEIELLAGSGRENIVDGPARAAQLAQPSGLALAGRRLYFADSEVSALRYVDLEAGEVHTVVGTHLFRFGDADGTGETVLLQHPLGVAAWNGKILVADTFNNKIKEIDPGARSSRSLFGTGEEALRDDALTFWEPGGIDVASGTLYVADTNNHRIIAIDLERGGWRVVLGGAGKPAASR